MKYQALMEDNEVFWNFINVVFYDKAPMYQRSNELRARVTRERILELRSKNKNNLEISQILDCSPSFIQKRIQEFGIQKITRR